MAVRETLIGLGLIAAVAAAATAPHWIKTWRLRHDVMARNAAYAAAHPGGVDLSAAAPVDLDAVDVQVACTIDPRTGLVDKRKCAEMKEAKARFDALVAQTRPR